LHAGRENRKLLLGSWRGHIPVIFAWNVQLGAQPHMLAFVRGAGT
jgi:hypothetical protein